MSRAQNGNIIFSNRQYIVDNCKMQGNLYSGNCKMQGNLRARRSRDESRVPIGRTDCPTIEAPKKTCHTFKYSVPQGSEILIDNNNQVTPLFFATSVVDCTSSGMDGQPNLGQPKPN